MFSKKWSVVSRQKWIAHPALVLLTTAYFLLPSALAEPVRITFLPPPLEGTLSLGIHDKAGKLVRTLHREATEKAFTVGLNGFITHWDGKDDAGTVLAAGKYFARGFAVGAVQFKGCLLYTSDAADE